MSNEIKNIYEAINAVMSKVGYVQKQRAAGLNYTYAGEAALIEAIRPWLVEYGIVVHPVIVQDVRYDSYTTAKGSVMNVTNVVAMYRFCHAPSGTSFDVPVLGEGADTGDKSGNKALTGAFKYALRQTLMIETGDDPDGHQSEPGGKRQGRQQAPVTRPAAKQSSSSTAPANVNTVTGEITGNGEQSEWKADEAAYLTMASNAKALKDLADNIALAGVGYATAQDVVSTLVKEYNKAHNIAGDFRFVEKGAGKYTNWLVDRLTVKGEAT